jgi:hypothetical protein
MSFWSKLFGGGDGGQDGGGAPAGPAEEYNGFTIRPTTMSAGSEFQLAGTIEKEIGGEVRRYDFVRADRFGSKTEAAQMAVAKGRQIIDEQGETMFTQSWPKTSN